MSSHSSNPISRRQAMLAAGGVAAAAMFRPSSRAFAQENKEKTVLNGRIKQSACKWCYGGIPLDQFCQEAVKIGLVGVNLLGPGDFATLKKHNLVCTMVNAPDNGIGFGFNKTENHPKCLAGLRKTIDACADAGFRNCICFSGNRGQGVNDEQGQKNMIEGLKQIAGYAEEKKVTVCFELLNSKRDHGGYMADHTPWGAEVCKAVGSPRVKMLYDIYHMQIMEGDVIATLKKYKDYIGHIHTGGVPGRNEIDETQELYYPAIMKALLEIKFDGYVAHEFIPKRNPLTSLAAAVKLCDL